MLVYLIRKLIQSSLISALLEFEHSVRSDCAGWIVWEPSPCSESAQQHRVEVPLDGLLLLFMRFETNVSDVLKLHAHIDFVVVASLV